MNSSRIKQLESIIEEARTHYQDTHNISYVFNPFTGQISSNLTKFGRRGNLAITWTWFPLFEHDKYIGYFAGDGVYYIENEEIVKIESVNSYFAKKSLNNVVRVRQ